MASDATSLHALAADLLSAAAASLGSDAPDVQFVTIGEPAYDGCELLAVHIAQLGVTPGMWAGANTMERFAIQNTVSLQVTILRCVKVVAGGTKITVPTAAQMTADAARVNRDGWSIYTGLRTRHKAGTLWTSPGCRDVSFGPVLPIAPQGGGAGWTIDASAVIDGWANG